MDEIKDSADYARAKSVLVTLYTDRNNRDYIAYLIKLVKERLAKAQISGLTAMAAFAQEEELHAVSGQGTSTGCTWE